MSAKLPKGGGGAGRFFSLKSMADTLGDASLF